MFDLANGTIFPTSEWISKCINDTGLYPSLSPDLNNNRTSDDYPDYFNINTTDFPYMDLNDTDVSLGWDICRLPKAIVTFLQTNKNYFRFLLLKQ